MADSMPYEDVDPTVNGLIAHLEQNELRSRTQLQRTRRAIRSPADRVSPIEFYTHRLEGHTATHLKWKGWLDWVLKASKETLCVCGHRKSQHYHSRGLCEVNVSISSDGGVSCYCRRFKAVKPQKKLRGRKT